VPFHPYRAGVKDLAPLSSWYGSVNARSSEPPFTPHLHYYNFVVNYSIRAYYQLLWWTYSDHNADIGDPVIQLGTDDPALEPTLGGSEFSPYGDSADSHEYVLQSGVIDDGPGLNGQLGDLAAAIADPASHLRIGSNAQNVSYGSCNSNLPNETLSGEVLRIVSNPGNACG